MSGDRQPLKAGDRVRFASGTTLEFALGSAIATSWPGVLSPANGRVSRARRSGGLAGMAPAERDTEPAFEAALREVGLVEQETIHLDLDPATRSSVRRAPHSRDRVVLTPPGSTEGQQVVLYVDESGGMSWHFPDGHFEAESARVSRRAGLQIPTARFTVDTRSSAALRSLAEQQTPGTRGVITKLGRKIFKVFIVPVAANLLKQPLTSIVAKIERRHRQEMIRPLTLENYQTRVTVPFTDFRRLATGPSLLVVHGMFSTTEGMLSLLPRSVMRELHERYEGRLIALDQLTVTRSPEENARSFLEALRQGAGGRPIEFDVLCHSRGGIVARLIAERGDKLVPDTPCRINKVYFVATPNQGSPLADPDHIVDMIDVFTNLATSFPDGPVTYSFEVLLAIIKLLAVTGQRHLPGLAAMGTKGFIPALNQVGTRSSAEYAAAAANYEPDASHDNGFFTGRFADSILDRVFTMDGSAVPNDLVVPREGVFGANGHSAFPLTNRLVFESADHIWHSGFFAEPRAHRHLLDFLTQRAFTAAASSRRVGGQVPYSGEWRDLGGLRGPGPRRARGVGRDMSVATSRGADGGKRNGGGYITRGGVRRPARGRKSAPEARRQEATKTAGTSRPTTRDASTVTREPAIDFHEQVRVGTTYPLVVRLADVTPVGGEGVFDVPIPGGRDHVDLKVSLSAPGFDIKPRPDLKLRVARDFDPDQESVTFRLTPRHLGLGPTRREIRAVIWYKNSPLGSVMHETYVLPASYKGVGPWGQAKRSQPFVLDQPRKDCDLIIKVEGVDDEGRPPYRIRLDSEIRGEEYDGKFGGELKLSRRGRDMVRYVQQLFADAFRQYPSGNLSKKAYEDAMQRWRQAFGLRINALGRRLWSWLPREFCDEYFRLHDAGAPPRSIRIHSHEMVVPWELVVPHRRQGTPRALPPLGAAHVMGRWRPGLRIMPFPQRLRVQSACVVNPQYPGADMLLWSLDEVSRLKKLIPSLEVPRPVNLATLRTKVLERGDIQFLHFSGHGAYERRNADLSDLKLEGGDRLAAVDLGATKLFEGQPIIYLNACNVGSPGVVVGRMGGFAAVCIEAGCSGIIAPYWPVNDETAVLFSQGFYGKLIAGRPIGEALQELRLEHPDDPTFLAYSYFGDPWAYMQFASAAGHRTEVQRVGVTVDR